MLTQKEMIALEPPEGLSDEELEKWYRDRVCEPDGSFIMKDDWADENQPEKPKSKE